MPAPSSRPTSCAPREPQSRRRSPSGDSLHVRAPVNPGCITKRSPVMRRARTPAQPGSAVSQDASPRQPTCRLARAHMACDISCEHSSQGASRRAISEETPAPRDRRTTSHLCRLKHCGCRPHRPLQPSPRCAVWEDNSRCCFAVGQWVLPGRQNSVRRGRKPMEKTKIDQTLRSGSFEFDLCQKSPGSSPKRSLRELVILTFENGRLTTREQRKAGLRPPCGTGTSPPLVIMPPVSRSEQSIAERGV